jgi:hypothetical protein
VTVAQPGRFGRDAEVVAVVDAVGGAMLMTGTRHPSTDGQVVPACDPAMACPDDGRDPAEWSPRHRSVPLFDLCSWRPRAPPRRCTTTWSSAIWHGLVNYLVIFAIWWP